MTTHSQSDLSGGMKPINYSLVTINPAGSPKVTWIKPPGGH